MTTIFTVSGRGRFPVDMLRYDEAFPADGMSAANIVDNPAERRNVTLITHRRFGPTNDRWASFGWVVSDVKEV